MGRKREKDVVANFKREMKKFCGFRERGMKQKKPNLPTDR